MVLIDIIILFIIFICLLCISMIWPPDSPWAPWWTTKPPIARRMCVLAKINSNTVIYDLGCGTGTALIIAAKEFGARGVGIEIDPLRFWNAWINVRRFHVEKKITIVRKNFFSIPLTPATVIFIYLIPNALQRLVPKLTKEITPATILVSYMYPMPLDMFKGKLVLVTYDKENTIYLYKMKK